MPDQKQTTIIAAGVRLPDGVTLSLPPPARHHDVLRQAFADGYDRAACLLAEQGFFTNDNEFVSREAALAIAIAADQCIRRTSDTMLFSEDVW